MKALAFLLLLVLLPLCVEYYFMYRQHKRSVDGVVRTKGRPIFTREGGLK